MKQTKSHSLVLKLQYKRLVRNNWNLKLPIAKAKENQELVPLASSQTLRFIDEIIGGEDHENEIRGFKKEIEALKLLDNSDENKKKIKELYSKKENLQFNKDYVVLVFDSKKEFDECKSKYKNDELRINGKKFYRLLGTAAGVKKQNIIYVSEDVCVELKKKLHNDRNIANKLIPAKLEAYLALSCSASVEVSSPKNIIVVNDCETTFTENVITIKDNGENEPILEEVDDYEIHLCDSDGYGLISPRLAEQWAIDIEEGKFIPTGFCIRFSFTKGMVFTFDYEDFAEKINGGNYIVKDAWGVERDVREADLILTTSMLKLWDSYDSCEDFLEKSYNNGWKWAVTKMCPKELEHERTFNYQFLQSFELSDEDVQELIKPTIDSIKDSLGEDYVKSLLFLRGTKVTSNNLFKGQNDYVKALMIEEGMLKDPYVIDRMYSMRQKRIKDAKIGVLDMHSNYAIVSGDPYALCQSMFGLEVTGILEAGEIYSDYWLNDGANEILLFRAPMTCHNNIRKAKVSNKEDAKYWYRYMKTCVVLNCWDTICDALNGMDKDSDAVITTNNSVLLRNFRETKAIICEQKSVEKVKVTEELLSKSNKDGFGDKIGSITNRITSMFDVLAGQEVGSEEYNTLMYRIMCGQHYQQNAIDRIKGIKFVDMPKYWYDYKACYDKIDEDTGEVLEDNSFNRSIVSNKKPYFFIYIYPQLAKEYNETMYDINRHCRILYKKSYEELLEEDNLTEEQEKIVELCNNVIPVTKNNCTMNKICMAIEKEFEGYKHELKSEGFDYSIMKTSKEYEKKTFNAINRLYKEYNNLVLEFKITSKEEKSDGEEYRRGRNILEEDFKAKCFGVCNNREDLCNIILDICYKKAGTKQFAWNICGDQIIKNLLSTHENKVNYPTLDVNGEHMYKGYKFKLEQMIIEEEI